MDDVIFMGTHVVYTEGGVGVCRCVSDKETEGEKGKEMQLKGYTAFLKCA